jgi:hypothetical protein
MTGDHPTMANLIGFKASDSALQMGMKCLSASKSVVEQRVRQVYLVPTESSSFKLWVHPESLNPTNIC